MFWFGPWLAHNGRDVVANAQGEMRGLDSSGNASTTVLPAFDTEGLPLVNVTSGPNGMLPEFGIESTGLAWWVSGDVQILVVSWRFLYELATTASAEVAASATAALAAQAAAETATSQLPPGGITGQALVKNSPADRDVAWATVTSGGGTGTSGPHSHIVDDLRKTAGTTLTAAILSLLNAADAQAARAAIGAGTGNGTSNLVLGSTSTTAASGDHTHPQYQTETQVNALIAAGGGGGSTNTVSVVRASGAYPSQPSSYPAGTVRVAYGSVPPTYPGVTGVVLDIYVPVDGI
jgi:hypothetical protein